MIYLIESGISWNPFSQAEKEHGEEKLVITDYLSMPYFGFCAQGLHGVIYLQTMATGKTRTVVFVVGATKVSGKLFWNNWSSNLISSG